MSIEFDTREFDSAIRNLAMESDRTDAEIVTLNAKQLVRSLAYNTPRDTGATRAGFWPAWSGLDMPGSPGTRRKLVPFTKGRRGNAKGLTYVPAGTFTDDRANRGDPSVSFSVSTHYVQRSSGRKVYYPYILNHQVDFWGDGHREAEFKFGRLYERLLRKHGKA